MESTTRNRCTYLPTRRSNWDSGGERGGPPGARVCTMPVHKVHRASKHKIDWFPPRHVRLVHWDADGDDHEPAVAGADSPAGDATPPMVPPVDAPVLPPSPQPTPPRTPLATPVRSDADEESDSPVATDEDTEDDLLGPDKTALAPAPSPAFFARGKWQGCTPARSCCVATNTGCCAM